MKGFFDTSVLVPVFYGDHVHHRASLALFIEFDKSIGCCGAHSLAEVYSTLTRMPGKHRISGEQAMLFIGSIRERLSIIALTSSEYGDALAASKLGVACRSHKLTLPPRQAQHTSSVFQSGPILP
jgi:predicted nucleic acid-binding protein